MSGEAKYLCWSLNSSGAVCYREDTNVVEVYSTVGEIKTSQNGPDAGVNAIALSPDSTRYAFCGDDGKIYVRKLYYGSIIIEVGVPLKHMLWLNDYIVTASETSIFVHDVESGALVEEYSAVNPESLVHVNHRDTFGYKNGQNIIVQSLGESETTSYLVGDGKVEFSLFGDKMAIFFGKELVIKKPSNFELQFQTTYDEEIKDVSWSPEGTLLALSFGDGHVVVLDAATWSTYREYRNLESSASFVNLINGGFRIAYGDPRDAVVRECRSHVVESNLCQITNTEDLLGLTVDPKASYCLANDFEANNWDLLGPVYFERHPDYLAPSFDGVLDGNGFTIKGLKKHGLFNYVQNITVVNLNLTGVDTSAPVFFNTALNGDVLFENCNVKGTVRGSGTYSGGYGGYLVVGSSLTMRNCTFEGEVINGSGFVGLLNQEMDSSLLENLTFRGSVVNGHGIFDSAYHENLVVRNCKVVGTIKNGCGICDCGTKNTLIENCHVEAAISTDVDAGGIIRCTWKRDDGVVIKDCSFKGSIEATGSADVAGIFVGDSAKILNCKVEATLKSERGYCSGIVLQLIDEDAIIKRCHFKGKAESLGRIGGICVSLTAGTVSECLVEGTVRSLPEAPYSHWVGGIAGAVERRAVVERSAFIGTAEGGDKAMIGGITGLLAAGTIRDCFVFGSVSSDGPAGGLFYLVTDSPDYEAFPVIKNVYFAGTLEGDPASGILFIYSISEEYEEEVAKNKETWLYLSSGDIEDEHGVGKTEEELQDASTFEGWDFIDTWTTNPKMNDGYPVLKWMAAEFAPPPARRPRLAVGGGPDVGVYVVQVAKKK